jgi:hypothetical protein
MELKTLIDAFMASYQGRDPSLHARLAFWRLRLGDVAIAGIDADRVEAEMSFLAERGALKYLRGQGIVPAHRPLSPATLNRHLVALGSVLTFARRRRLLPRSHVRSAAAHGTARARGRRASHLAMKGASSVLLADTLGHRSLRMVTRYAHLSIDARARAIEEAFQ